MTLCCLLGCLRLVVHGLCELHLCVAHEDAMRGGVVEIRSARTGAAQALNAPAESHVGLNWRDKYSTGFRCFDKGTCMMMDLSGG